MEHPALPDSPRSPEAFDRALADLQRRFEASRPEMELTVRDPSLGLEGHVVVWNTGISAGGPLALSGKGGTRITPGVTLDEIRMLARVMALKNAAAGLPLGGAKSGLRADPSQAGFEAVYRRFVRLCAPVLHERGGPFGGFGFDLGARPEHALWACDELRSTRSFTGKPRSMGGTDYDREGIAGLGVAMAGTALLEEYGVPIGGATFAVQGVGALGAAVVRYFGEMGGRLVAVGDPRLGGTWQLAEPPSPALTRAIADQAFGAASVLLAAEANRVSDAGDAALWTPAEIVFPCAVQDVIADGDAARLRTRFVCEGANAAITESAHGHLHESGIAAIPDFIANAGGVIAAFVELTSDESDKAQAAKQLARAKIAANVRLCVGLARQYRRPLRQAAMYVALARLFGGGTASGMAGQ